MLPDTDRLLSKPDDGERKGDRQTQLNNARDAVTHAREKDPSQLASLLAEYAHLLASDRQYEQARVTAQEVLQIEQRGKNAVEALITLGVCAAYTNQLDEAERHFRQAVELSRRCNDTLCLSRALQSLTSMVLILRGQFHLALTLIEEAGIAREEQAKKHWNEAFWRGFIYQTVGDRRHCREVLDELVGQFEPGSRMAAAYYLLWSRLALDEDELDQAKEYLRLGLRVVQRLEVTDLSLWIRLEYSRYHRLINEAAVARNWADDALQEAQQHDWHYFIGLALIERAQSNWESADPSAAEADLREAEKVLEPLCAVYYLTRIHYLRALWHRQTAHPQAESAWLTATRWIIREGYAFLLEKEQDNAFPLVAAHVRSKNPEVRSATETLLRHLATVPPPPLRIWTLGQFAVWKGRRRIPDQAWSRRKAGELFRFLLLQHNRAAGHEVIIEALWPDHPSGNPSDLLHQATSALRHALEPDLPDKFPSRYVKVEGEQISLALPPGSEVDFEHFERALPIAMQTRSAERLQEALNLYSGEIFPSDRYADWSEEKRQFLAELRQRGLLALARTYLESSQHFYAINCCRQVLHTDPWNEDAVLLAMQAYSGLNDIPHALQVFKELENILKTELQIQPRQDLRTLAQQLRQR